MLPTKNEQPWIEASNLFLVRREQVMQWEELNDRLLSAYEAMSDGQLGPGQLELVEALKNWRKGWAGSKPQFMVFPDTTLYSLVVAISSGVVFTNVGDLKVCYGLGDKKLAEFGQNLLELVRELSKGREMEPIRSNVEAEEEQVPNDGRAQYLARVLGRKPTLSEYRDPWAGKPPRVAEVSS